MTTSLQVVRDAPSPTCRSSRRTRQHVELKGVVREGHLKLRVSRREAAADNQDVPFFDAVSNFNLWHAWNFAAGIDDAK